MINGIMNIYKERGFTSHDVVAKLRGIIKQKRIGHTGTLDPEAEGVLPVCLGNGTGLCELLTDKEKTYLAVMKLGVVTDTQDMTGSILVEKQVLVTEEAVSEAVFSFEGDYDQVPPMYSALKVNGRKLCDLAREGKTVERSARRIRIHSLEITDLNLDENLVTILATCSKGTYIRTLCEDIGVKLGCGGCMKSLVRLRSGSFCLENSLKLSEVEKLAAEGRLTQAVIPVADMFSEYPEVIVNGDQDKLLFNGNPLSAEDPEMRSGETGQKYRIYASDRTFAAIYEWNSEKGLLWPFKMFLSGKQA